MIRKGRPRILFGELDHDTPVIKTSAQSSGWSDSPIARFEFVIDVHCVESIYQHPGSKGQARTNGIRLPSVKHTLSGTHD